MEIAQKGHGLFTRQRPVLIPVLHLACGEHPARRAHPCELATVCGEGVRAGEASEGSQQVPGACQEDRKALDLTGNDPQRGCLDLRWP